MKTAASEKTSSGGQASEQRPAPSLARRLMRLVVALGILWVIVNVLAPLPIKHFAPMRDYAAVVDRTGITPGALYYNDVDQSLDAETNNRDAIRFLVKGNAD